MHGDTYSYRPDCMHVANKHSVLRCSCMHVCYFSRCPKLSNCEEACASIYLFLGAFVSKELYAAMVYRSVPPMLGGT
jgi:hypothetical protein